MIIIVLGGGLNLETQQINLVTQTRYNKALDLGFDYIICTGDRTYKKEIESKVLTTEARAGFNYLISKGVDKDKIILEEKSRDTFSNMYYSREILDKLNIGKNVTIITSKFHMPKSKFLAEFTFDDSYILNFIEVDDSLFNQDELNKRITSEQLVLDFYMTHLEEIYKCKKSDMISIGNFIKNINPAVTGIFDSHHRELTQKIQKKIGKSSPIY